ncbi:hypothetical protein ACFE04_000709 [Oxalis oulophora]
MTCETRNKRPCPAVVALACCAVATDWHRCMCQDVSFTQRHELGVDEKENCRASTVFFGFDKVWKWILQSYLHRSSEDMAKFQDLHTHEAMATDLGWRWFAANKVITSHEGGL